MAENLEILDVRIGAPRPSTVTNHQRLDISIDVMNNSKNALHLISSVRTLDYDPASRTLMIGLTEPEPQPGTRISNFIKPHTITIPAKSTQTIEVSVPALIHKIVPSTGLGTKVEDLDVTGVQHARDARLHIRQLRSTQINPSRRRRSVGPFETGATGPTKRCRGVPVQNRRGDPLPAPRSLARAGPRLPPPPLRSPRTERIPSLGNPDLEAAFQPWMPRIAGSRYRNLDYWRTTGSCPA